jgi:hypothetical protein
MVASGDMTGVFVSLPGLSHNSTLFIGESVPHMGVIVFR